MMTDNSKIHSRSLDIFKPTRLWIFDLDNTLYPSHCNLFAQIDQRMSGFIQELLSLDPVEARRVQKQLYYDHGTTMSGLMAEYGVKPQDFMDYVHDIDLATVPHSPELAEVLAKLPGRKFIFTNGSKIHAERVAEKLGILAQFHGIFDIAAGGYIPKPKPESFKRFLQYCGEAQGHTAMFEDLPHNLETAHACGMTTVLVHSDYLDHPSQKSFDHAAPLPDYIHFKTTDLTAFLQEVTRTLEQ